MFSIIPNIQNLDLCVSASRTYTFTCDGCPTLVLGIHTIRLMCSSKCYILRGDIVLIVVIRKKYGVKT